MMTFFFIVTAGAVHYSKIRKQNMDHKLLATVHLIFVQIYSEHE